MGMVPWGAGADGTPGELLRGGFSASQPAARCLLYAADFFSFQHSLVVRDSGSLKLGIGSPELGAVSLLPGTWEKPLATSLLRGEAGAEGMGTHQLGAFVGAIPSEDESVLAWGNGHHRRVDQAQLHDASVVASQGGCVVEADSRGVVATWQARGRGCKSPWEK